jgi:hypothetical protein
MLKEEVESSEANEGHCVLAGSPPGFSQSEGFILLTDAGTLVLPQDVL